MKILWLGCGDIGNRFGKYVHNSHQCFGVRRQIANVQSPLTPILADILDRENMHSVMSNDFDVVIVTLTPDEYSPSGYWKTYFEGASSIKYALDNALKKPKLVIWVSSTRVYRDSNEDTVDESTPLVNSDEYVKALICAENKINSYDGKTVIIRFSGIYGERRCHLLHSVLNGFGGNISSDTWTNRIHIEDCVRFIAFLVDRYVDGSVLENLYIGTDNVPVKQTDIRFWLAKKLNVTLDKKIEGSHQGYRLKNNLLLGTGFRLKYPSYKEGYENIIETIDLNLP